ASRCRVATSPRVPISPRVRSTIPKRRPLAFSCTSVPAQESSMSSAWAAIARTSTGMGTLLLIRLARALRGEVHNRHPARGFPRGQPDRGERLASVGEHPDERRVETLGRRAQWQEHHFEQPPPLPRDLVLPLGRLADAVGELLELVRDLAADVFERGRERRIEI